MFGFGFQLNETFNFGFGVSGINEFSLMEVPQH